MRFYMKKIINFILSLLICSTAISCGNEVPLELKEATVAEGICKLFVEKKYEAAFTRMNESYRAGTTLEKFQSEIETYFADATEIKKNKMELIDENNSFYSILCSLKTDGGNKYCNFIFSKGNLFPVGVNFLSEKPKITKNENSKKDFPTVKSGDFDLTLALGEDSLKDLCSDYFKLGCGIYGYNMETNAINHKEYMEVAKKHFNSCTLTNLMKPVYVLSEYDSIDNFESGNSEPVLNFQIIEDTLKWCKENNVQMRGHTLVWHTQAPKWFFCQGYDSSNDLVGREEMIGRLDSFTKQYMGYVQDNFPGVVYCWDVVNEAVDPSKGDKNTNFMCRIVNDNQENYWYSTIGPDYPEVAFKIARKYAADGVKLFYNDYGTVDKTKRNYIYNLCKDLKEKGLIDGIGMQSYWDMKNPKLEDIKEAIELYASLDVEIQLTEWSMSAKEVSDKGFAE
ncbi:MAG: endo-1,4-beta-xylanase, partial [Treponema bryantii]|nr:endo-1,4-beta-xylanase [Treponema bryantii]